MQCQVLIIRIVVMRRMRCQGLIIERPFLVSIWWKKNGPLFQLDVSKVHHDMGLWNVHELRLQKLL